MHQGAKSAWHYSRHSINIPGPSANIHLALILYQALFMQLRMKHIKDPGSYDAHIAVGETLYTGGKEAGRVVEMPESGQKEDKAY